MKINEHQPSVDHFRVPPGIFNVRFPVNFSPRVQVCKLQRVIEIVIPEAFEAWLGPRLPSGNLTQLLKMAIYRYLQWIFPLKIVIFHSYVSLPEGIHLSIYLSVCLSICLCGMVKPVKLAQRTSQAQAPQDPITTRTHKTRLHVSIVMWVWVNTYRYLFQGDEHRFTSYFDVHQGYKVMQLLLPHYTLSITNASFSFASSKVQLQGGVLPGMFVGS